jgi:hypothetical protein
MDYVIATDKKFIYVDRSLPYQSRLLGNSIWVYLCMKTYPEYNDLQIANQLDMQMEDVVSDIMYLQEKNLIIYTGKFHCKPPRRISKEIRKSLINESSICSYCGSTEYLQIDHKIPISRGGSNRPDNLQVLCKFCNQKKAAKYD